MLAACPERRISMSTNVATAIIMNAANENRKMLSTVSTAEASTIRKARMASVTWSRSRRSENIRTTTPNKCQVYRGRQEAARKNEVVDGEKDEVGDRERRGPALRRSRTVGALPADSRELPALLPRESSTEGPARRCWRAWQSQSEQADTEQARSSGRWPGSAGSRRIVGTGAPCRVNLHGEQGDAGQSSACAGL